MAKTLSNKEPSYDYFSRSSTIPLYTALAAVVSGNSFHTVMVMDNSEALLVLPVAPRAANLSQWMRGLCRSVTPSRQSNIFVFTLLKERI